MIRPILRWPDPRLRRPADPVAAVDDAVRAIGADMIATMAAMPGAGLAAPQIGAGLRLAVVDASGGRGQTVRMANPEVSHAAAQRRAQDEASPCLPGVSAPVARPATVTVRFLNEAGTVDERTFTGLWATAVQHQIGHRNGRRFIGRVRRDRVLRRAGRGGR